MAIKVSPIISVAVVLLLPCFDASSQETILRIKLIDVMNEINSHNCTSESSTGIWETFCKVNVTNTCSTLEVECIFPNDKKIPPAFSNDIPHEDQQSIYQEPVLEMECKTNDGKKEEKTGVIECYLLPTQDKDISTQEREISTQSQNVNSRDGTTGTTIATTGYGTTGASISTSGDGTTGTTIATTGYGTTGASLSTSDKQKNHIKLSIGVLAGIVCAAVAGAVTLTCFGVFVLGRSGKLPKFCRQKPASLENDTRDSERVTGVSMGNKHVTNDTPTGGAYEEIDGPFEQRFYARLTSSETNNDNEVKDDKQNTPEPQQNNCETSLYSEPYIRGRDASAAVRGVSQTYDSLAFGGKSGNLPSTEEAHYFVLDKSNGDDARDDTTKDDNGLSAYNSPAELEDINWPLKLP